MLKKSLLLLSMLTMSGISYAESGFGICDFGATNLPSIVCNGPAFLKGTTVGGDIKITGRMQAYNVKATLIAVTGTVDIHDSLVNGEMVVTGNLDAFNTEFKKSISLNGNKLMLNKSIVRGEIKMNSQTTKPVLTMVCGAAVAGSVNFIGKEGLVQVTGDSMVKGKVLNGTLEFLDEPCPNK